MYYIHTPLTYMVLDKAPGHNHISPPGFLDTCTSTQCQCPWNHNFCSLSGRKLPAIRTSAHQEAVASPQIAVLPDTSSELLTHSLGVHHQHLRGPYSLTASKGIKQRSWGIGPEQRSLWAMYVSIQSWTTSTEQAMLIPGGPAIRMASQSIRPLACNP